MGPRASALISVLLLLLARTAYAEPIRILEGAVAFDTGDPPGLQLSGHAFSLVSLSPFIMSPIACVPKGCVPTTSVNLSVVFGAPSAAFSLGQGFAVVGNSSYGTQIGCPGCVGFRGQLSFDAATLPIAGGELTSGGGIRLTSPFVLTGSIAAFEDGPFATLPLFHVDVTGRGIASLLLQRDETLGGYQFVEAAYTIHEPVPEPATLLLFGSGLTVAAIGRYRRP